MVLERKTLIELAIAASIVVVISVLGFWGYGYYIKKTDVNSGVASEVESKGCEELNLLTPDNTKAPVAHVLSAKLNKNAGDTNDICAWSIDGVASHTSIPVSDSCMFGDKIFDKAGVRKVTLDVAKNNCSLSKEITVN